MIDTSFMQRKFSVDEALTRYMEEIKKFRPFTQNPSDETKLQLYYQAANTFKRATIKDWVQFALSWGRGHSPMSEELRGVFPTFLGNRANQPSQIDLLYAQLLLAYAQGFKQYRGNLKEWMLRFVLNSKFSPLHGYFERELDNVIQHTREKITVYQRRI